MLPVSHCRPLAELSAAAAARYLAQGQFPPGSMGPKVEAALEFVRSGGGLAVITSAARFMDAVQPGSRVGTRVVASHEKALA